MTRFVSGVALAASAFALVWFLASTALLAVALAVAGLAFSNSPGWPARSTRRCRSCRRWRDARRLRRRGPPWVHVPSLLGVILVALGVSLA